MKCFIFLVFVACFHQDRVIAREESDIVVFGGGKGCPPGLIKDGGEDKYGSDVLLMPGKCKKKMEMKKVEFVPYPVKEYVPIYVKKGKKQMEHMPMEHMPMEHMPMEHMPMEETPMELPMEMPVEHMDFDYGQGFHGLDSRRHVTRVVSNRRKPLRKTTTNRKA